MTTRITYEGYIRRVIRPTLGDIEARKLRAHTLDRFYLHLRRCSQLCDGKPFTVHLKGRNRKGEPHDCEKGRCRKHICKPMAPASIRQVHSIIRAPLGLGVKWDWLATNVAVDASPPKLGHREVAPPEPPDVVRLIDGADEEDPAFGLFIRLAIVTGARRGELCALRWTDFDLDVGDVLINRAYVVRSGQSTMKRPKSHQAQRLALGATMVSTLRRHRARCEAKATAAGTRLAESAYVFAHDAEGEDPWLPDTVSHQFTRLARSLGIKARLHDCRHFAATHMLASGVDLRTAAGRQGHGGGAITLNVYAHRVRARDSRAADLLAQHLAPPAAAPTNASTTAKRRTRKAVRRRPQRPQEP